MLANISARADPAFWPSLVFVVQVNWAFIDFANNFIFHAEKVYFCFVYRQKPERAAANLFSVLTLMDKIDDSSCY